MFRIAQGNPLYMDLDGLPMGFGAIGLREAARMLGPSFVYDVFVSELELLTTINCVREWNEGEKNPVAPQINVSCEPELHSVEWFVRANGKSVGSKGYG